jgi:branched-chain amino acid transport system substrate-binding protein
LPTLATSPRGPLVMVSHAISWPGLTKPWGADSPAGYYPQGLRNLADVAATEDAQCDAAVKTLRSMKKHSVAVYRDGTNFGAGMMQAFRVAADRDGLPLAVQDRWSGGAAGYTNLFARAKSAGADAVVLLGNFTQNGAQVIRDKVSVLGSNTAVPLVVTDGFSIDAGFARLPEAAGAYSFVPWATTGLITVSSPAAARFVTAYEARYGPEPMANYAVYAVMAAQVVLEAVRAGDGSARAVQTALFSSPGVRVPASTSVFGREIRIDPATGNASSADVTLQVVRNGAQVPMRLVTVST